MQGGSRLPPEVHRKREHRQPNPQGMGLANLDFSASADYALGRPGFLRTKREDVEVCDRPETATFRAANVLLARMGLPVNYGRLSWALGHCSSGLDPAGYCPSR